MLTEVWRVDIVPDSSASRVPHIHLELASSSSWIRLLTLIFFASSILFIDSEVVLSVLQAGLAKSARRVQLIAGKTTKVHDFK